MWIWLTAQFSEEVAMNVTKLFMNDGVVDAGFVRLDGENLPIVKAEVETEYDPEGAPVCLSMVLHGKLGGTHVIRAKIIKTVKLPFTGREGNGSAVMYEILSRYEFGGRTGTG